MYRGIAALLEQYMIDRVISSASPVSHGSKAWLGLIALAGFFLSLACIYAVYAFSLWAAMVYAPHVAALLTAALCLGVSVITALTGWLVVIYRRRHASGIQDQVMDTIMTLIDYVDEELREPVVNNPKTALAIASAVGFVAGKRLI